MRSRTRPARPGFTLIELLVVVAVIALLISILLPALRDAREQAKIAKCLSNYRQVMISTVQYLSDENDNFCNAYFALGSGDCPWIAPWCYGGRTEAFDGPGLPCIIPTERRPLNKYLMGGKMPTDLFINGVRQRADIPVLHCPSDLYSRKRQLMAEGPAEGPPPPRDRPAYDDVGTSYLFNLLALISVVIGDLPINCGGSCAECTRLLGTGGRELIRDTTQKHSSTYVMYFEEAMDVALVFGVGMIGNHGRYCRFEAGFLDGHAEIKYMDTRGWCGPGWTVLNPEWVVYSDYTPPIYYDTSDLSWGAVPKTCEPPSGN